MHRPFLVTLCLSMLAATAGMSAAQELRAVLSTSANLRAGPGTDHAVVGRTEPGRTYYQFGREGRWIRVWDGWVNEDYVERVAPLTPAPTANVRVEPPKVPFQALDGTVVVVSPDGTDAIVRMRGSTDRLSVVDLVSREVGKPLNIELDPDRLTNATFQFLSDRHLAISKEADQIIIDLMADKVIYDGSPVVFSAIGIPGETGFSQIVSTNGSSVFFTDPDSFELVDSRFDVAAELGLPDFPGQRGWLAHYGRFAGLNDGGVAQVLFASLLSDGKVQQLRLGAVDGTSRGPLINLEPGEMLFAAFPALNGFLTVEAVGHVSPMLDPIPERNLNRIMAGVSLINVSQANERDTANMFGNTLFDESNIRLRFRDLETGALLRSYGGTGEVLSVERGETDHQVFIVAHGTEKYLLKRFDLETFTASDTAMSATQWLLVGPKVLTWKEASASREATVEKQEHLSPYHIRVTRDGALELPRVFNGPEDAKPEGWSENSWFQRGLNDLVFDLNTMTAKRGAFWGVAPRIDKLGDQNLVASMRFMIAADGSASEQEFDALMSLNPLTRDLAYADEHRTGADDVVIPASVGRPRRGFDNHPTVFLNLGTDVYGNTPDLRVGIVDGRSGVFTQLADLHLPDDDANRSPNYVSDLWAIGGLAAEGAQVTHFYFGTAFVSDDGQRLHMLRLSICANDSCSAAKPVDWYVKGQRVLTELATFDTANGVLLRSVPMPATPRCTDVAKLRAGISPDDLIYESCDSMARIDGQSGTVLDEAFPASVIEALSSGWQLLPDGKVIVHSPTGGPSLSFISARTGTEIAQFYLYPDASWVLLSDAGFYAAGADGDRNLVIRQGQKEFEIDKFRTALYRPDLVFETMRGDPEGLVAAAIMTRSLEDVLASGEAPQIDLSVDADKALARASVQLHDSGGGIGSADWLVNGVVRHRTQGQRTATVALDLAEGLNVIQVVARNGSETIEGRSASVEVVVSSEDATPPRLFIVAAGVDAYQMDALDLEYAVPDARRMATAFETAGRGLYDEIFTTLLTNAEVTRENLGAVFEDLAGQVRPNDVFVFFLAGHGKTIDGRYHFVPPNFSGRTLGDLRDQGIGQSLFADWFSKIPAQKSLLLFDTCDSGSLVETVIGRTMGNALSNELLGTATGRAILSASSSQGVALEGYQGSGLFTYVLIDALGTADRDADGFVNVFELSAEVAKRLPTLALSAFGEDQKSAFRPPAQSFQVVRATTAPQ